MVIHRLKDRMYGDISSFHGCATFKYNPVDLTRTADDWEDCFVAPALDVALAYVENGNGPPLKMPDAYYKGAVDKYYGIEARVLSKYEIGTDSLHMRVDIRYPA